MEKDTKIKISPGSFPGDILRQRFSGSVRTGFSDISVNQVDGGENTGKTAKTKCPAILKQFFYISQMMSDCEKQEQKDHGPDGSLTQNVDRVDP